MKKKKLFSLLLCVVLVFSMAIPAVAYDAEEGQEQDEEIIAFSVNDMTEIEEGVFYVEIPLETHVFRNVGVSTYDDCTGQFVTVLNAKYYSSTSALKVGATVSRVSGTGLLKSINGTLGYKQYKNDGTYIQSSSDTASDSLFIPYVQTTLSIEFNWVYFDENTGYIVLSANGSFTLVDGYGTFYGSNKSVTVVG